MCVGPGSDATSCFYNPSCISVGINCPAGTGNVGHAPTFGDPQSCYDPPGAACQNSGGATNSRK